MQTIELFRKPPQDNCTLGEMGVPNLGTFKTLEPYIPIAAGRYEIIINWSPKFQRRMPLLEGVPNHEGIRIHIGNWPKDTTGCILIGRDSAKGAILHSKQAFDRFFEWLDVTTQAETVYIIIHEGA